MMRRTVKRLFSAESGFWKTIWRARTSSGSRFAIRSARGRPSSSTTEPSSGGVSPRSTRANVVLPLPDSPTRPSVSPARTSTESASTARTSCPSWRNVLATFSARTTGTPFPSRSAASACGAAVRGSDCA